MLADLLTYILLPTAFVSAVFFLPKWLYWITPHAHSAYDVLANQYGRKVALWVYVGLIVIFAAGMFLLEATKHL